MRRPWREPSATAYWHCGAPSDCPVIGGVALPTKIPHVLAVALLLDVADQPVPDAATTVTVFPADTLKFRFVVVVA
jgi:hypothetical protein